MAIPRYGIWYIDVSSDKEIVVGVCHNWNEASKMAKDLYAIKKKIDKACDVVTGVFLFEPSVLYTSTKPKRWQIMPLQTSNT